MGKLGYYIIHAWVKLAVALFYKRITVKGLENLKKGQPTIYLANHQNTLLDALVLVVSLPMYVRFLARADMFANSKTAKVLDFFKISPVYRLRDGASQVKKNASIFAQYAKQLKKGENILLFPEGTHTNKWIFRPLKKGYQRLLEACKEQGVNPDVVPIIIHYEDHYKGNSCLLVEIGQPLPQEKMHDALVSHFQNNLLRFEENMESHASAQKSVYQHTANQKFETFIEANKGQLALSENPKPMRPLYKLGYTLTLLFSWPIFAIGVIFWFPIHLLATLVLGKIPKDPQFVPSFVLVAKMIFSTIVILGLAIYCFLIFPSILEGTLLFGFILCCWAFVPFFLQRWNRLLK